MIQSIIDLLIRIKDFSISQKPFIIIKKHVKFSKILYVLYKNGLIQSFGQYNNNSYIINTRFYYNKPILVYLKIFSKPSISTYLSLSEVYQLPTKKFLYFFSTSRGGIMTQLECKKQKIGGKILFVA